jgi:hypothetical protein|tara:strand:- start:517 stop:1158 length:642 start_codon:yes stop_codon:yes gene_type:complete
MTFNKKEWHKQYYLKNKECIKEYHNKYYKRPEIRERRKQVYKKWMLKNKEHRKEYKKEYYLKNKERTKEYDKEYRLRTKERRKQVYRKWILKNKERRREWSRIYLKEKRKTDINFRIRSNLGTRIHKAVKGINKSASTMELIGCTIDELRSHIKSQFKPWMNWKNYGLGGWDIDHVKACAKFDLTCPIQQRKCFNWRNLQPMDHIENIIKGVR